MSCDSLSVWTFGTEQLKLQLIIPFIFSLKRWFIRAYTKGLTAELNMIIVWTMGIARVLSFWDVWKASKMWSIMSVPQQITKMALTVKTIKVTRLRIFSTPCVQRYAIRVYNRWELRIWTLKRHLILKHFLNLLDFITWRLKEVRPIPEFSSSVWREKTIHGRSIRGA